MAKKRNSPPDEPVKPEDAVMDGEGTLWSEGVWNGIPMLTCLRCQWDTLEGQAAADAHARTCPRCAPKPIAPASSGLILVADRYGNERPMAEEE